MGKPKHIAIIPARAGSKGLPGKNSALLGGKPLIAHSIAAALESKCFDEVVVTTDGADIRTISEKLGARVVDRPAQLASDEASSLDAIEHCLRDPSVAKENFELFMLLQPTSPLRTATHIRNAFDRLTQADAHSLVSVTRCEHPAQKTLIASKEGVRPIVSWEQLTAPRQQLEASYRINGAIYLTTVQNFLNTKNLFTAPLAILEMSAAESVDIDTQEDLQRAEQQLK